MAELSPEYFRASYRSHVEEWEIDQNRHWNSKFFVRSFEYALDWILAIDPALSTSGRLLHRHMAFHRELLAGVPVEAGAAALAGDPTRIFHVLWNGNTGEVCATGTDRISAPVTILPELSPELAGPFATRSLSMDELVPADTGRILAEGAGVVVWRGLIRPQHADHLGRMLPHALNSFVSEGQAHVWKHGGIPVPMLIQKRIGRVLVEMTMTPHATAMSGEGVELVAWFEQLGGKVFGIRYQLNRSVDASPLASLNTVGVFFDLANRVSIAPPDELFGHCRPEFA